MTETRCKWAGSDNPRILVDRHKDDCPGIVAFRGASDYDQCKGCLPCPMDHCRVCGVDHSSGACPDCVGEVRDNLAAIIRMCSALPEEAESRGVEGEAMNLLGPSTNTEAWHHRRVSTLAGRIVPLDCEARDLDDVQAWLDTAEGELHPLWVTGSWQEVYADAFGHDLGPAGGTIVDAVAYLDQHLTGAASEQWVPFEDMARDVRRCVAHLEAVLHDGEQVDRGAPCMACGKSLERTWGIDADHDGWKCPRCNTMSTEAQYRFAVAHLHREEATHLTDRDMELRTGVKAGTVRVWARRGLVERRTEGGRVVYSVAQVESEARQRGLLAS